MSHLQEASFSEEDFPLFAAIKQAFGFIPNFYRGQMMRPDLVEAEAALVNAILIKEGALSRRQREYVFLVCSAANLSTYCVTAHCEIVRMIGLKGPEPEQVAVDHVHTDIPVADKALLNFAIKLTRHPTKVGRHDIDALRAYDFSDQAILEAIVIVGIAKFANWVSFGLGTVPDFDSSKVRLPKE